MNGHYLKTNGINLHYLHFKGDGQPLVLLHGLTANAHAFDGLIKAGLSPAFDIYCIDLRGRGKSGKPETGYSIRDHALDVLGLIEELPAERVTLVGHSFGALVSVYLAHQFPDRVEKVVMMDIGARVHPKVKEMVAPSVARLLETYPSLDTYLEKIRSAPYLKGEWYPEMDVYYEADVEDIGGGQVKPRSKMEHIQEAVEAALDAGVDWMDILKNLPHPTLLIQAQGDYHLGAPLLPEAYARETVNLLPNGHFTQVSGNHITMLFGPAAEETSREITKFVTNEAT